MRIPFRTLDAGSRVVSISFLVAVLTLAGLVSTAGGQSSADAQTEADSRVISGRVVHDDRGVPGTEVTLHRITAAQSGPVQSVVSSNDGSFHFPLAQPPDPQFEIYFATAEYHGVRFFGPPMHADSALSTEYRLAVYDTTSILPESVRVTSRYMFMFPDQIGGWEVLEILNVLNPTSRAFVSDGGMSPWEFRLPTGATDFQVGDGGVLPHELTRVDDRVLYVTPLTPGTRDLLVSYRLPQGPARSTLQLDERTDSLHIFVRQPAHLTNITGVDRPSQLRVEGEEFLRYSTTARGSRIEMQWGRGSSLPVEPHVLAVVMTVVVLGIGIVAAIQRRRVRPL